MKQSNYQKLKAENVRLKRNIYAIVMPDVSMTEKTITTIKWKTIFETEKMIWK